MSYSFEKIIQHHSGMNRNIMYRQRWSEQGAGPRAISLYRALLQDVRKLAADSAAGGGVPRGWTWSRWQRRVATASLPGSTGPPYRGGPHIMGPEAVTLIHPALGTALCIKPIQVFYSALVSTQYFIQFWKLHLKKRHG